MIILKCDKCGLEGTRIMEEKFILYDCGDKNCGYCQPIRDSKKKEEPHE